MTTLSAHARPGELIHPHVTPGNRILALTTDATTAGADRANVQTMVDNTGDFTPVGVKQIYAYDSRNRLTSVWENTAAGP